MSSVNPYEEGFWARTKRKNAENPFILPSVGATLYAMYRMTSSMLRSDKVGFQQSQQTRVAFQFLAIGALVGGIWYQDFTKKHEAMLKEKERQGLLGSGTPAAVTPTNAAVQPPTPTSKA